MISEAGAYTFSLTSDDGSRLTLDDERLINNDGVHGMREKTTTASLSAGEHKIELLFFQKRGGSGMIFKYAGPDTGGRTVVVPQIVFLPVSGLAEPPTKPTSAPTEEPTKVSETEAPPRPEAPSREELASSIAYLDMKYEELLKIVNELKSR